VNENEQHLKVITAPTMEPVQLEELKLHSRITSSEEDTLLFRLIRAATRKAERWCGRSFISQTWELSIDGGAPGDVVTLPRPDLQSVTSVTTYDTDNNGTVFSSASYTVEDGRASRFFLDLGASWPSSMREQRSVVVQYVSGYGDDDEDVPDDVREAVMILAAYWYEHRDEEGKLPRMVKELLATECVTWL
jgi:uncharacterized phiE125 gp8 family phage protein